LNLNLIFLLYLLYARCIYLDLLTYFLSQCTLLNLFPSWHKETWHCRLCSLPNTFWKLITEPQSLVWVNFLNVMAFIKGVIAINADINNGFSRLTWSRWDIYHIWKYQVDRVSCMTILSFTQTTYFTNVNHDLWSTSLSSIFT
jgi:hypothetical protein